MINVGLICYCKYTEVALLDIFSKISNADIIKITPINNRKNSQFNRVTECNHIVVVHNKNTSFYHLLNKYRKYFIGESKKIIIISEADLKFSISQCISTTISAFYFIPMDKTYDMLQKMFTCLFSSKDYPLTQSLSFVDVWTKKEFYIMKGIYSGMSTIEIAKKNNLSGKTISAHKKNALMKVKPLRCNVFFHVVLMNALGLSLNIDNLKNNDS